MIKTWHKHYGIYGLAQNSVGQLLVVKKILGPYRNRYDLPGGSLNKDESLKDCLRREFIEETGFSVRLTNCCGVHDFLLNTPYNGCEYTQQYLERRYPSFMVRCTFMYEPLLDMSDSHLKSLS